MKPKRAVTIALVVVLLAGGVGGVVGQSAPNETSGTNETNGSGPGNGTTAGGTAAGPVNTTVIANATATNVTNGTGAANITSGTNTTNVTNQSGASGAGGASGGGFGFGMPSTDEITGDLVDATVGKLAEAFENALAELFLIPFEFITMRFAPFEGATPTADGPLAIWERPDAPLFGQIYDIAMDSMFYIALLIFGAFFLIDWFGNFSAHPGADGPVERLFLRAADCLHLLFSWPIAWGHFLLASVLTALFLPGREAIASTVNEGLGGIVGLISGAGAVVVLPFLLIIMLWLLLKHVGAFIYLLVGLAAYPALVAAGIPDHRLLGRLGNYAENTRQKFIVAAWWTVPTAVVLGFGYAVDGALLDLLTAGDLLNDAAGGAVVYPILWLAALYAPIKVFSDGSPPLRNWKSGFSRDGGGPPAGGGGGGPPPGGGSSALIGGAAAGALAAGTGSAATSGTTAASSGSSGAFSRLNASSPSQRTLEGDGGLQTMNAAQASTGAGSAGGGTSGAKAIGGGFGPSPGAGAGSTSTGTSGSYSAGGTTASDVWGGDPSFNEAQNVTPVTDQSFNAVQRYEPYVYHENSGFQRIDPPKSSEWLTGQGGIERLNEAYDEPVRFKGENDGQMYDLRRVNPSDSSFNSVDNSGTETIRET